MKGGVTDEGGQVLATSASLDRSGWLELDRNATLAVKNTETSREVVFVGPGRVFPCVAGEERFYIVRGGVRTAAAVGARPGAEVLLATPHGVIWYGDARLDIKVEAHALTIFAGQGDAWLETRGADGTIGEEKIAAGKQLTSALLAQ